MKTENKEFWLKQHPKLEAPINDAITELKDDMLEYAAAYLQEDSPYFVEKIVDAAIINSIMAVLCNPEIFNLESMKSEIESVDFKEIDDRQDYLSIDRKTAISAEGLIFHVGDIVRHESGEGKATIRSFEVDYNSNDVVALTSNGPARISFLY